MPNCFSLQRKSAPDINVPFNQIDDEICAHMGITPDPDKYYLGWYNIIGLALACGQSFPQIINSLREYDDKLLLDVAEYLNDHFTSNAWVERKY
jgi:hypothetical protein